MSTEWTVSLSGSVADLDKADWDACAGDANPFVSHDFLAILEESGFERRGKTYRPRPVLVREKMTLALPAA